MLPPATARGLLHFRPDPGLCFRAMSATLSLDSERSPDAPPRSTHAPSGATTLGQALAQAGRRGQGQFAVETPRTPFDSERDALELSFEDLLDPHSDFDRLSELLDASPAAVVADRVHCPRPPLSQRELRLFSLLCRAVPHCRVLAKVGLDCLVEASPRLAPAERARLQAQYSGELLDFVVQDLKTNRVVCIVELDHSYSWCTSRASQDSDFPRPREMLLGEAGYPVLKVRVNEMPGPGDLRERMLAVLDEQLPVERFIRLRRAAEVAQRRDEASVPMWRRLVRGVLSLRRLRLRLDGENRLR